MKVHQSSPADPLDRLCRAVHAAWPPERWSGITVLVAVSGGADSVALLRTLAACRQRLGDAVSGRLLVAHFNHRLRGSQSDADARFVTRLADALGLICHEGAAAENASGAGSPGKDADAPYQDPRLPDCDVGVPDKTERAGLPGEALLRRHRYDFLLRTAHQHGARYVAVGHTRDDNAETVLHQLFRGTGSTGLAGMPPHRDLGPDVVLVRPLLGIGRQQIRAALRHIGQPWREDPSNADPRWKRNWIRHVLLPQIEAVYPGAGQRIAGTAERQRGLLHALAVPADDWSQRCLQATADEQGIWIQYEPAASTVVIAALRKVWEERRWPLGAMTSVHWRRLHRALRHETPACFDLPGGVQLSRSGTRWLLRRLPA